ncbi:hypothetical cytosolic protein [Syntrophus aciditrophicus SB]|uniref:Hypothetical cytosolic protein n=2 Tax=Syntrophus TaxID=43773 RepID=Q2LT55_SYNAS|nr:hypothetical cytosolic protein [Syntrophus aciditrophicus SB]
MKRRDKMEKINKISIKEFKKQEDGSWVAVQNSDIQCESGKIIRIEPGFIFKKGITLAGADVASALDEICEAAETEMKG